MKPKRIAEREYIPKEIKTLEDLLIEPSILADYLGLTKYGVEELKLTPEELLVTSGICESKPTIDNVQRASGSIDVNGNITFN